MNKTILFLTILSACWLWAEGKSAPKAKGATSREDGTFDCIDSARLEIKEGEKKFYCMHECKGTCTPISDDGKIEGGCTQEKCWGVTKECGSCKDKAPKDIGSPNNANYKDKDYDVGDEGSNEILPFDPNAAEG